MKIDIGPDGRILGTKRVSPNGQVSGFTEYAGLDVLVILPGGRTPVVRRDASDVLAEVEALVRQRMELAFRQYRTLRENYPTPEAAARAFLRSVPSKRVQGLLQKTDAWIRDERAQRRRGRRPTDSRAARKK